MSLQRWSLTILPPASAHSHGVPVLNMRPRFAQHASTVMQAGLGLGTGVSTGRSVNGHSDKSTPSTSPPASLQAHGVLAVNTRSSTLQHASTAKQIGLGLGAGISPGPSVDTGIALGSSVTAGMSTVSFAVGHTDKSKLLSTVPPVSVQSQKLFVRNRRPSAMQQVTCCGPKHGSDVGLTGSEGDTAPVPRAHPASRAHTVKVNAVVFISAVL